MEILRPIHFEIVARGEHVGDIDREVITLKERCHCKTEYIPYKCMTRTIIEKNLEDKVHWNNIFTPKDFISQAIEPSVMIPGNDKPDYSNLKLGFGKYCQVYEKTGNDMMSRSVGGTALSPKHDRG